MRIYHVELHGQGRISILHQTKSHLRDDLKKGPVSRLIDFMVSQVDAFLTTINKQNAHEPMAMGFVISFPLHQTSLKEASVLHWTKDFDLTGADNKDIVRLLQNAFNRQEVPVVVEAVVNGAGT